MKRTVRLKIESRDIRDTMEQYFEAYCYCVEKGIELHTANKKKIHNATYYPLRKLYPRIPSNLLQTARDVACETIKSVNSGLIPKPKNKFIRYDNRKFSYKNGIVSIATINGWKKFQITLPKYAEKYDSWNCKAATVTLRNGQLWLNMIFNKDSEIITEPTTFLGIDRGIRNIAVCSDNSFYNSKRLKSIKGRYQYLKSRLQSKGTRSAKRHLKKIGRRERLFVRDVNHCLSKEMANKPYDCFVLEKIEQIPKTKGRVLNGILKDWSYGELGNFVEYKTEELGKMIMEVEPKNTSKKCSRCGYTKKMNRIGSRFKCRKCGFELDADLNASRNIVNLGMTHFDRLNAIQPIVSEIPDTNPMWIDGVCTAQF